jgi:hypothetical protein
MQAGKVGRLVADGLPGRAGGGQAAGHPGHGAHRPWRLQSAPRPSAAGALPQPQAPAPGGRGRARGDLLGKPGPDAGANGHRLGQLPSHAIDVPSDERPPPQADEAVIRDREHLARRGDRRKRPDAHVAGGRDSPAPVSTCTSMAPRSTRDCGNCRTSSCCLTWDRRPSRAGSRWAKRSSSTSRPLPTATARLILSFRACCSPRCQPHDRFLCHGDGAAAGLIRRGRGAKGRSANKGQGTTWNSLPPSISGPWRRSSAIDLVLAGDNAIVIGLAAAGLPKELRARAIHGGHHSRNGNADRALRQ